MTTFTVTGDIDPFLQVSMQRGERIFCESNAMVMMDATLELKGKMRGGLGGALMRSLANGESFFQQNIEATGGDGTCLLSPNLPGAMRVLEVGAQQYMISDGAFVAASSGVDLKVRTQNVGNALFGQSGGFFVTESAGQGQLVVSGFGALHEVQVEPGREVVIDNAHVVAWDSALRYDLAVATRSSGGLLGNLVNSVTSGEGMVLRFSGRGKVLICSRNREAFVAWMMSRQTS
ncbi:TIGR00266 family protein [Pseudoduganella sp.]|uniref:TIGR00266 family protein n=1 Tax=Pseudoduganella sp. TaxID=1880898 RepID=UPI0035B24B86